MKWQRDGEAGSDGGVCVVDLISWSLVTLGGRDPKMVIALKFDAFMPRTKLSTSSFLTDQQVTLS